MIANRTAVFTNGPLPANVLKRVAERVASRDPDDPVLVDLVGPGRETDLYSDLADLWLVGVKDETADKIAGKIVRGAAGKICSAVAVGMRGDNTGVLASAIRRRLPEFLAGEMDIFVFDTETGNLSRA